MKKLIVFLLAVQGFCGSVTLFNDSPFRLKATILSATGENLGVVFITPQHQITWQDSFSGGQTFSQTPYSVIWFCEGEKEYGVVTNVATGAFVTANSSDGPRICPIPKQRSNPPQSQ